MPDYTFAGPSEGPEGRFGKTLERLHLGLLPIMVSYGYLDVVAIEKETEWYTITSVFNLTDLQKWT
jgi:hypothetical protein